MIHLTYKWICRSLLLANMVVSGSEHNTFALCIIYTWQIVLKELPSLIVDFKHYGFLQDIAHNLFDRIV